MMVESEAYELTEAEMLAAVTFAPCSRIQPEIDLIIDLPEQSAKEPFRFLRRRIIAALYRAVKGRGPEEKMAARPTRSSNKQERTGGGARRQDRHQGRPHTRTAADTTSGPR